jgi:hypothetical protein
MLRIQSVDKVDRASDGFFGFAAIAISDRLGGRARRAPNERLC